MNKEDLIKDINKLEVFIIEDKDKYKGFQETVFIKRRLVDLFGTEYPPEVLDVKKFRCKNIFADMFIVRLRLRTSNILNEQLQHLEQENEFLIKKYEASLKDNEAKTLNWLEFQGVKKENEKLKEQQRPLEVDKELYDAYCETHCRVNDIAIDILKEFDFISEKQIIPIIKEGIRILRFQRNKYRKVLEEIRERLKAVSYLAPSSTRDLKYAIEDIIKEMLDAQN